MGLFRRPPKLNLSEYRDIHALTAQQKFTLKVYAMHAVGANPIGADDNFLPESEINERLRRRDVNPNDYEYLVNLLLDRRMFRMFG